MNDDNEAIQNLNDLKKLSQYCSKLLTESSVNPDALHTRKKYVYSLFMFGLSFVDGIITLAERRQSRSIEPLVRGIQEAWIHLMFVYSTRSQIWMHYTLLQDELKTTKKRDDLHAKGEGDPERYKIRTKEAKHMRAYINRRYKELPVIPNVVASKGQTLESRTFTLKDECKIIDYYRSLKPKKTRQKTVTQVGHYELVYSHLSGTSHVTPLALNGLYKRDSEGRLHIDISGGGDTGYLSTLIMNAYLYQYQLMRIFMERVTSERLILPDDIKLARRRMVAKRKPA